MIGGSDFVLYRFHSRRKGSALDASILEKVAARMPDSLLIPEEHTEKYYAYPAPFQSFLFHGDTGTAQDVFYVYPSAFSVNMINDVNGQNSLRPVNNSKLPSRMAIFSSFMETIGMLTIRPSWISIVTLIALERVGSKVKK